MLVGVDDLFYVLIEQAVLAFAFFKVLGGVDKENVVGLFAFLEDEDANRNAGGVKEIRGKADDRIDVAVFDQLCANLLLGAATKEHTVRKDDGHDTLILQVVEAVEKEGE